MYMTLAELKRTAEHFEWALVHNSWYPQVPDYQAQWRAVTRKNSVGMKLKTFKNGEFMEGSIDWPKATEVMIKHDSCHWVVTINRLCGGHGNIAESTHTMIYHLRPNLNSVAA